MPTSNQQQILSTFPFKEIKLSYETPVHKKVHGAHISIAIPDGIKSYAWLTTHGESNVCWIMEITNGSITKISGLTQEFNVKLSYGTIFYGTIFECHNGQSSFSIEDVLYFKGKNVCRTNYLNKLNLLNEMFKRDELKNPEILFGLPIMNEQFYTVLNAVPTLMYKSSAIHFRYLEGKLSNTTFIMKYIKPRTQITNNTTTTNRAGATVFSIVADVQPDVYHLTAHDGTISVACIPSYTTSVMMNTIFRTIKENTSLDALEESDDEEDFEDTRVEKYLILKATPIKMKCEYNYKFKKWTPVSVSIC